MSTTSVPLTRPDEEPSDVDTAPRRPLGRRLASSSILYLAAALGLLILVFGMQNPEAFLGSYNVRELFTQASLLLVVAVGANFVIATAGISGPKAGSSFSPVSAARWGVVCYSA